MKTIPTFTLFAFLAVNSLFADLHPANLKVLTDFKTAEKQSKETGKPVFLEFMSSTCPHCQAFAKNVLSDPAFVAYANENLIVVIHDYQELSKLPADEKSKRRALMKKYEVTGFPTIVLLGQDRQVLSRTSGYSGAEANQIIADLQKSITANLSSKD